jgi:2-polyprenyl-3-methyl-5-hydroxy-6-metoxy-1,4-benzoquinol methylase
MVSKPRVCRICGNSINNDDYNVKEMMFGFGDEFHYFKCSNCDCLQIAEFPENVEKYYPPNYYSFTNVKAEINKHFIRRYLRIKRNEAGLLDRGLLGKILCKKFPADKDEIALNLPIDFEKLKQNISFKSRILDVGCGNGVLLCKLQGLGFKHLLGIDPFIDKAMEYSNGVKVKKMIIHDVDGVFDFIMFHHSFEHMADPFETLTKVSRILSNNGICLIRIPVVSSYAWTSMVLIGCNLTRQGISIFIPSKA